MRVFSRATIAALVAIGLALGTFIWMNKGQLVELVLTEDEIAEKLSAKFPIQKTYFLFLQLGFSDPQVSLQEGSNRISFSCEVITNLQVSNSAERAIGPLRGRAKISGLLSYDPDKAEFLLREAKLEEISVAGIPEKWQDKLRAATSKAISEFLEHAPLYRLRPTDLKKKAARLVLRGVRVEDRRLKITMGFG